MFTAFQLPAGPALRYGRVSTDDQTVETQHHFMRDYCARLPELHTGDADVFLDPDTSGTIPFARRPAGGNLLRRIEAAHATGQPVRHLVVVHIDRLGRDSVDIQNTVRHLWNLGVIPHWLDQGPVPRTAANELIVGMRSCIAQFERDVIVERTCNRMHVKRAAGEPLGHSVPYGQRAVLPDGQPATLVPTGKTRDRTDRHTGQTITVPELAWPPGTRWEPDPAEQAILGQIHGWAAAGWNCSQIAAELNRLGHRAKQGGPWQHSQVQKCLNQKHTGTQG